jgi:hypothetical protein
MWFLEVCEDRPTDFGTFTFIYTKSNVESEAPNRLCRWGFFVMSECVCQRRPAL